MNLENGQRKPKVHVKMKVGVFVVWCIKFEENHSGT